MSKVKIFVSVLFLIVLIACNNDPEPINFGTDQCDHCRMKIMDKKYGAELITKKGKVFKFDAAECMINYLKENKTNQDDIDRFLVIAVNDPGNFTDALTAKYLISPKLKSPMGENLSAFTNENIAGEYLKQYGGEIFIWEDVKKKIASGD